MGIERQQYEQFMGERRGKDFERDLFGLPNVGDPKYREELRKVADPRTEYVPFPIAFDLVKKIQPKTPRPFALKLLQKTAEVLRSDKTRKPLKVRFWTSVETPLDIFHSADAILELLEEGRAPQIVRLDATTASKQVKENRGKQTPQDVVVIEERWLNLENEDELQKNKIPALANQIAKQFK